MVTARIHGKLKDQQGGIVPKQILDEGYVGVRVRVHQKGLAYGPFHEIVVFDPDAIEIISIEEESSDPPPKRRKNPKFKVGDKIREGKRKGKVHAIHSKGTVDVMFDDMDYPIRRQLHQVRDNPTKRRHPTPNKYVVEVAKKGRGGFRRIDTFTRKREAIRLAKKEVNEGRATSSRIKAVYNYGRALLVDIDTGEITDQRA